MFKNSLIFDIVNLINVCFDLFIMVKYARQIKKTIKQSLPFLLVAGIGELIAGVMLGLLLNKYTMPTGVNYTPLIPGVLVILPSLMNLRGAISSTFAARLGSAYHLGLMKRGEFFSRTVKEGIKGSFVLAFISSVAVAFFAYFASKVLGTSIVVTISGAQVDITLGFFLFIAVVSSLTSALILAVFTVILIRYSIKKKLDPDNVTIPLITTLGDILLVFIVYIMTFGFAWVAKTFVGGF